MNNESKIQSVANNAKAKAEEAQQLLERDLPPVDDIKAKVYSVRSKISEFNWMKFPKWIEYSKVVNEMIALYQQGVDKRYNIQYDLNQQIKLEIRKYNINRRRKIVKKFIKKYFKITLILVSVIVSIYVIDYYDLIDKFEAYVSLLFQEMTN